MFARVDNVKMKAKSNSPFRSETEISMDKGGTVKVAENGNAAEGQTAFRGEQGSNVRRGKWVRIWPLD